MYGLNRREGASGNGQEGWRKGPSERWWSGNQEERQEINFEPFATTTTSRERERHRSDCTRLDEKTTQYEGVDGTWRTGLISSERKFGWLAIGVFFFERYPRHIRDSKLHFKPYPTQTCFLLYRVVPFDMLTLAP